MEATATLVAEEDDFDDTSRKTTKRTQRKRNELQSQDILEILAHWKSKLCSVKDLAQRYKISYALAHQLTKDFKRDPDYLVRLRCKEQIHEEKVQAISDEVA